MGEVRAVAIAKEVLAILDAGRQRAPYTDDDPTFSVAQAYGVAAGLRRLRLARGERQVGRKIGFTNRSMWAQYGVFAPIWGDIYDRTVEWVTDHTRVQVSHLPEPRIEPEIVLGLETALLPGMNVAEIAASIGWIAHGFEIVQSIYPGWKFRAADCIADGGLHGKLVIGRLVEMRREDREKLPQLAASAELRLLRNGIEVDRGTGANVLEGPVEALSYLVELLGSEPSAPPLAAGEMVTTGTLTGAFPIAPGETWATEVAGLELCGLSIEAF